MPNENNIPDNDKNLHNQRPRFLDPSYREKAELGYFLNEEDEPVEVEIIGTPAALDDDDFGIPRPLEQKSSVNAKKIDSTQPEHPKEEEKPEQPEPKPEKLEKEEPAKQLPAEKQVEKQAQKKAAKKEPVKPQQEPPPAEKQAAKQPEKKPEEKVPVKQKQKKSAETNKQGSKKTDLSKTQKIEAIKQAQKNYEEEKKELSGEKALPPDGGKKRKKSGKSHWARSIVMVVALVILAFLIAATILFGLNDVYAVAKPSHVITVEIPKDSHASEIADILGDKGVVELPWLFKVVMKLRDDGHEFQYGTYTLNSDMDYEAIIEALKKNPGESGENVIRVTFKEGQTLDTFGMLLEKEGICKSKDFVNAVNLKTYGLKFEENLKDVDTSLKYYRMEGYAFPDTYDFYKGESADSVARKFLSNFDSKITDEMVAQMGVQGLTFDETITLASIVQAEAANSEDMLKVASVLLNRVRSGGSYPKLQSDPTKKYAADLQVKLSAENKPSEEIVKAYNTYEGNGIPPGAICNPGIDAIKAVLYPEETNYFYFCANVNTKECYYAATLEEHNKNLVKAGIK